ncbi:hypothetical protein Droror1_Dr00002223 [Drosera rotundifolia]
MAMHLKDSLIRQVTQFPLHPLKSLARTAKDTASPTKNTPSTSNSPNCTAKSITEFCRHEQFEKFHTRIQSPQQNPKAQNFPSKTTMDDRFSDFLGWVLREKRDQLTTVWWWEFER